MKYYGDYHIHTRFSDCRNTVEGVVKTAIERGLKEVAITDHGYANKYKLLSLSPEAFDREKTEVEKTRIKYPKIKILHGIEADIIDFNGTVDMTPEQMDKLDIFLCGFHRFVNSTGKEDYKNFVFYNGFVAKVSKPTPEIIEKNTQAFVSAIKNYPIDVLTHVGHLAAVDVGNVAKTAAEYNTFMELNVKHINLIEENIDALLASGCTFIVDSDSHSYATIGEFGEIDKLITKYSIPVERIANYGKRPLFTRLEEYKKARKENGQTQL